nr:hypothetical protein [Aquihabitans sp. G128]
MKATVPLARGGRVAGALGDRRSERDLFAGQGLGRAGEGDLGLEPAHEGDGDLAVLGAGAGGEVGADREVPHAVPVEVAEGTDLATEPVAGCGAVDPVAAGRRQGGERLGDGGRGAVEDVGGAGAVEGAAGRVGRVEAVGAEGEVGDVVAVHVAEAGHRVAGRVAGGGAVDPVAPADRGRAGTGVGDRAGTGEDGLARGGGRVGVDAIGAGRAEHDGGAAVAGAGGGVGDAIGADEQVGLAVAVDVAGCRDGDAEAVALAGGPDDGEALGAEVGGVDLTRGAAEHDVGRTRCGDAGAPRGGGVGAEQEVVDAVAVDVADAGDVADALLVDGAVDGQQQLAGGGRQEVDVGDVVAPGDDPHPAVVGAALGVGGHLGHREVVQAVGVQVTDGRHGEADVAAALAALHGEAPVAQRVERQAGELLGAEDHVGLLRRVVGDGDVVEVVAVDVADAGHGEAGEGVGGGRAIEADRARLGGVGEGGARDLGAAEDHVGGPDVRRGRLVPEPGADDGVVVAVAVDVAGPVGQRRARGAAGVAHVAQELGRSAGVGRRQGGAGRRGTDGAGGADDQRDRGCRDLQGCSLHVDLVLCSRRRRGRFARGRW